MAAARDEKVVERAGAAPREERRGSRGERWDGIASLVGKAKTEKRFFDILTTYQALSLFNINWSLRLGGHWRAKVRGWLHERRVTDGIQWPREVRPSVFRLRHPFFCLFSFSFFFSFFPFFVFMVSFFGGVGREPFRAWSRRGESVGYGTGLH